MCTLISGSASAVGTDRYRRRFPHFAPHYFHHSNSFLAERLWISSLGMGTYLGGIDQDSSAHLLRSLKFAMHNGCNLFDTAHNYRHAQSERDIGAALAAMLNEDETDFQRDEFVICSKGGYLLPNEQADTVSYADQVVNGDHCLAPAFLSSQIARSRRGLQIETIDRYFLQNPEVQLGFVSRAEFADRMRAAFLCLEREVAAGTIKQYGVATWDGLRVRPEHPRHLSLADLVQWAQEVGGSKHHFRAIQFPYNLGMAEAFADKTQRVPERGTPVSLLDAAAQYDLLTVGSMGLMQGQLVDQATIALQELFVDMPDASARQLQSNAPIALQVNRSTPGLDVTLAGMNSYLHVEENLQIAKLLPLHATEVATLLNER